jgi:cell division protein FtsZ
MSEIKMCILGIGGCGCNIIGNLKMMGMEVPMIAVNTDAPVLAKSRADYRVLIGESQMKGRGAAGSPMLGREIAESEMDRILDVAKGMEFVVVCAGLGGGTGTGGLPAVAETLKEQGKLVMSVVTLPLSSEGTNRKKNAQLGLTQTLDSSDMTIVNSNDIVKEQLGRLSLSEAFRGMDKHLVSIISSVTDLQSVEQVPGIVNVDFSNFSALIKGAGLGFIGSASGKRLRDAFQAALKNDFCKVNITNCKGAVINVKGNLPRISMTELESVPAELSENYGIRTIFWGVKSDWRMHEPLVSLMAAGVSSPLVDDFLEAK